jgi:hypothetical protein
MVRGESCPTSGANTLAGETSRFSILFYNFAKEFAEEFFDLEELVDVMNSRRAHPDWIVRLPTVAPLVREASRRRLKIELLGTCINPTDGAMGCAALAYFESASFLHVLERELKANWESAYGPHGSPPVEFLPLFDSRIDEWARTGGIDSTSMFALDLARLRLHN